MIGEKISKENLGMLQEVDQQSEEFEIDLIEAIASVTPEITFSSYMDGHETVTPVGASNVKLLVADTQSANYGGDQATEFALLVVKEDTNEVHGIAQRIGEEMVSIRQNPREDNAGFFTVAETSALVMPTDWKCGNDDGADVSKLPQNRMRRTTSLNENHHDNDHLHYHDNFTINVKKNGILHEIQSQLDSFMNDPNTYPERRKLRSQRNRKLYATDFFPKLYSYQVDLYVEIDQALVNNNDNNVTTAIEYVNAIISAASAVYEKEIDTHCEFIFYYGQLTCFATDSSDHS